MYARGQGVALDYVRAYMWFDLGAASGYAPAVKNRDIVAQLMTPSLIEKAKKLARDCQQLKFNGCD